MALRTASVSGLWSNTATWGGSAVPVNSDTVVINSGVDVEFDVDQSGFANGIGVSTINGTLHVSNTPGTYFLKCSGTWTWGAAAAYRANNGTPGQPLPANVTFTQNLNGVFQNTFNATTVIDLNCQQPTHVNVKLSQAESLGATTLHIDTDLTADTLWASGAVIRVDNVAQNAQSEERTLTGSPTSTTIAITVGLTAAKSQGSVITLISRNVKILSTGISGGAAASGGSGGVFGAEIRNCANGLLSASLPVVSGTISGCANGLSNCLAATISGSISGCSIGLVTCLSAIVSGTISGCSSGLSSCATAQVSGLISGCQTGLINCTAAEVSATISGCTSGLSSCGVVLRNATLQSNSRDLIAPVAGCAFNTLFGSATEYINYNVFTNQVYNYMESFDHDHVTGAYRNWPRGGITSSNTGTVYGTRTRSYQHVLELGVAGSYSFRDQVIEVPAGGWVNVTAYMQKDASMAYLPRLQIFPASAEPLITGSPSAETIMTDSLNSWEILFAKYQNTSTAPQLVKVRVIGQNASGNVYEDTDISLSPFGWALGEAQ